MDGLIRAGDAVRVGVRPATVLFADLSGFTALVESVRPETVYALVRPLMDELVSRVRAHDGDIQQVLGDGFMAVFGLDSTSGYEVAQAVRAATALVCAADCRGGRLPVHVGIESGEVLVSPSWEPARFGVWGRPVNVAARLCDLAGPGTINIGPRAFHLGAERTLADIGVSAEPVRYALKGVAGEVAVHRVGPAANYPHLLAGCAA
jgi:class 3 adenylate cyclase